MKGIVCRGLFHDDLLLQCNDANGRALPTSHCGGVSGPCIHLHPEAVPLHLMQNLLEAYILHGPQKAHAQFLEYR